MFTEDTASAVLDDETKNAISVDRTKGDFTFPENHKFDAGWGLTSATVDYICDVKQDPDWVRLVTLPHRGRCLFLPFSPLSQPFSNLSLIGTFAAKPAPKIPLHRNQQTPASAIQAQTS